MGGGECGGQFLRGFSDVIGGEERGDNRDGVGAGANDLGDVLGVDSADGDDGQFAFMFCLGDFFQPAGDGVGFCGGGKEGAHGAIICAVLLGLPGFLGGVMAGCADDCVGSDDFSCGLQVHVILAEVDSVRADLGGEARMVVDDKERPESAAQLRQRGGLFQLHFRVGAGVSVLEDCGAAFQRGGAHFMQTPRACNGRSDCVKSAHNFKECKIKAPQKRGESSPFPHSHRRIRMAVVDGVNLLHRLRVQFNFRRRDVVAQLPHRRRADDAAG